MFWDHYQEIAFPGYVLIKGIGVEVGGCNVTQREASLSLLFTSDLHLSHSIFHQLGLMVIYVGFKLQIFLTSRNNIP